MVSMIAEFKGDRGGPRAFANAMKQTIQQTPEKSRYTEVQLDTMRVIFPSDRVFLDAYAKAKTMVRAKHNLTEDRKAA